MKTSKLKSGFQVCMIASLLILSFYAGKKLYVDIKKVYVASSKNGAQLFLGEAIGFTLPVR